MKGIVYILSNRSFWLPERHADEELLPIFKIGKTDSPTVESLKERMNQIFKTGVAVPFDLEYARVVENSEETEKRLHGIFAFARVNENREFFRVAVESIIKVLELVPGEEITIDDDESSDDITEMDLQARDKISRRANFSFDELEIATGETLTAVNDESITVTVKASKLVVHKNETMSLSYATKRLLTDGTHHPPLLKWKYKGETLQKRRDRMGGLE